MRVGILLPGFSSSEQDWAIPVQLNLVREMSADEDVRVLALRYPFRRDCYSIYGATVYSLGVGQVRSWRRLKLWADALLTLRHLHHKKPFDVLHAMWADETGLIAAWAGRMLGIPVVVSIAGGELVGFEDLGYGLQRSAFSRWIVGQALYGADRIIPACTYARNLITQAGYNVSADKIQTITLGVDANIFKPSSNQIPTEHKLIHVASLLGVKDQATLLRALARLETAVTSVSLTVCVFWAKSNILICPPTTSRPRSTFSARVTKDWAWLLWKPPPVAFLSSARMSAFSPTILN